MKRRWLPLLLGLVFFLPGCGELTPCESNLQCVILCQCPNGGDGFAGGYRCQAGYCRDGHKNDRDCERICQNIVPSFGDDDDSASDDDDSFVDDDDSNMDDDDSARSEGGAGR